MIFQVHPEIPSSFKSPVQTHHVFISEPKMLVELDCQHVTFSNLQIDFQTPHFLNFIDRSLDYLLPSSSLPMLRENS
jgi:hypothetical protein